MSWCSNTSAPWRVCSSQLILTFTSWRSSSSSVPFVPDPLSLSNCHGFGGTNVLTTEYGKWTQQRRDRFNKELLVWSSVDFFSISGWKAAWRMTVYNWIDMYIAYPHSLFSKPCVGISLAHTEHSGISFLQTFQSKARIPSVLIQQQFLCLQK